MRNPMNKNNYLVPERKHRLSSEARYRVFEMDDTRYPPFGRTTGVCDFSFNHYLEIFILFISSLVLFNSAFATPLEVNLTPETFIRLRNWKFHPGDHPDWSLADYDDSHWSQQETISKIESDHTIVWYRMRIRILNAPSATEVFSFLTVGLAKAYEIFWDGEKIGQNGSISSEPNEVEAGEITNFIKFNPQFLQAGDHILALRVSNDFPKFPIRRLPIYFGNHIKMLQIISHQTTMFTFTFGFNSLAILLSIALFLIGGGHRSYLYFGLNRFCYLIYELSEIAIYKYPLSMTCNDLFTVANYIFDPIASVFLSLYILFNFNLPRKRLHLVLNLLIFLFFYFLFGREYTMLLCLYPTGMVIWAVKHKKPGSTFAFWGLGVLNIISFISLFHSYNMELLIISDKIFVFFALLSITSQVRAQEQNHQASILRSARLESQLLKKNIQPHFLMNTLLTIISLIKKSPADAIKLIHALANEFQMINKMASQKLIPVEDEIAICQKHLEIMGYRKKATYQLFTDGFSPEDKVPPMIFHTLIENGLTHSYEAYENGTFYLTCEKNAKVTNFILKNDGSKIKELISLNNHENFHDGLGMRYVKSQLEESYPNRWEMKYGLNNGFWEVTIKLKI